MGPKGMQARIANQNLDPTPRRWVPVENGPDILSKVPTHGSFLKMK